ncbi:hypothetical protein MMC30_002763 [Trapelia coarctata]|nr:hypothetical protein [Trapelia coarctata]
MDQDIDIPVIDFKPFLHGSAIDRQHVASTVDEALRSVGFLYITNHGIDQRKIDESFHWSKRFFALSESEKEIAQRPPDRSNHRGYSGVGNGKVRERVCMSESFDVGNPKDEGQPNTWLPEELLPGFREFMGEYFQDCTKLIHQLLDCLSLALNLPATDSLAQYHRNSLFKLCLLHYPALSAPLLRSGIQTRIPAHSDFGTLTLLFQDNVGGLEIADLRSMNTDTSAGFEKNGRFRPVEPKPGTVVVNVGYLLMRWSNGRWRNTVHRVSEPPTSIKEQVLREPDCEGSQEINDVSATEMISARYSIPFFASPDSETIVEALPGCWSEEVPKRWKPISAGDYLRRKMEGM